VASAQTVIGVSMLTLDVQFHREVKVGLEKAAKDAGYELALTVADLLVAEQAIQIARFAVQKKVAAIVITPCDSASVGIPIEQANRYGVPVFTLDIANTSGRGKVVSHVASDNLAGGRKAGELMIQALDGRGKILVATHPGVTSMADRVRGFKEVVAKAPGIQLVGELPVWMDARKESTALIAQTLRRTTVNGIFGGNDEFALGAVAAVEAAGKTAQVKIIGYDGTEEARAEIRRGRIYGDVVQHPADMAALAVRAVRDHLAGRSVPQFIAAELSVCTGADARAGA
jgi:ribose transport system substrate-binding protein